MGLIVEAEQVWIRVEPDGRECGAEGRQRDGKTVTKLTEHKCVSGAHFYNFLEIAIICQQY